MAISGRTPINVTPLIDIVLVLLIIFMVISPMMEDDRGIQLPEIPRYDPESGDEASGTSALPVTVLVTKEGQIFLSGQLMNLERLGDHFRALTMLDEQLRVRVHGDKQLEAQAVLPVLEVLRASGVRRISLGVKEDA